jgi:hypothetical protein
MKIGVRLVFHAALVRNELPYHRPQLVFVFAWPDGLNNVSALERKNVRLAQAQDLGQFFAGHNHVAVIADAIAGRFFWGFIHA